MIKLLLIGCGGFIGAIARYGLSGLVHRTFQSSFPYGTLVVNVAGCLVIGGMLYFVEDRMILPSATRAFLMIGILGAFTTFSTFGYETVQLLTDGRWSAGLLNVAANVILGLAAVWLGRIAMRIVSF